MRRSPPAQSARRRLSPGPSPSLEALWDCGRESVGLLPPRTPNTLLFIYRHTLSIKVPLQSLQNPPDVLTRCLPASATLSHSQYRSYLNPAFSGLYIAAVGRHLAAPRPGRPVAPTLDPVQGPAALDGVLVLQPLFASHASPAPLFARSTHHHQPSSMTSQRSGEGSEIKPSVIAATQVLVLNPFTRALSFSWFGRHALLSCLFFFLLTFCIRHLEHDCGRTSHILV